jgi:hypothetical protein
LAFVILFSIDASLISFLGSILGSKRRKLKLLISTIAKENLARYNWNTQMTYAMLPIWDGLYYCFLDDILFFVGQKEQYRSLEEIYAQRNLGCVAYEPFPGTDFNAMMKI